MCAWSVLLVIVVASHAYEYGDLERPGEFITIHDDPLFSSQLIPLSDNEDPLNENESIDSVFEKKVYFAFKLKNEKLQRRVSLVQEMAKLKETELWREYGLLDTTHDAPLNTSFVPAHQLELHLSGFYYDETEQRERFNATLKAVARSLCDAFPRYLTFTRFVVDYGLIRGRLQETDIDQEPIKKILSKHGFTHRADSDISSGNFSGFVAVREHLSLKVTGLSELSAAAKVFLQKPLRASVYVDTLYACVESSTGACEEIASMKIGSCDESVDINSGSAVSIPNAHASAHAHRREPLFVDVDIIPMARSVS